MTSWRSDNTVWKTVTHIYNSVSKIIFGSINRTATLIQFVMITSNVIRTVYETADNCDVAVTIHIVFGN